MPMLRSQLSLCLDFVPAPFSMVGIFIYLFIFESSEIFLRPVSGASVPRVCKWSLDVTVPLSGELEALAIHSFI